jgi:hypothetical protein
MQEQNRTKNLKLSSLSCINNRAMYARIVFLKSWENLKPASFNTNLLGEQDRIGRVRSQEA